MNEANTATYDVPGRRAPYPALTRPTAHPAPRRSICRAHPLDISPAGTTPWAGVEWQVREDQPFYVPDLLTGTASDADPELYAAADQHAKHLRNAQRTLEDTLNLACVLSASFQDERDDQAVHAETVLKIIERKVKKALDRLDRHSRHHKNLFFAYFELEDEAETEERDTQ